MCLLWGPWDGPVLQLSSPFSHVPLIGWLCAASFNFQQPTVFEADNALGEITGLFMIDEEGEMATVDVNAKFINGKPDAIECKYEPPCPPPSHVRFPRHPALRATGAAAALPTNTPS